MAVKPSIRFSVTIKIDVAQILYGVAAIVILLV
ncbi:hypothetical protein RHODGE_RHODGE_04009 [Rhodoplanes serenus]|uniref:Uncharacterized protein n=1 Tax=Rhodoplanes serenus TaxID=200615 RepID=A0A3S4B762_9BRAD|nr:hypothetical protein RHODGE_RHODGE_04009 [Rhodoplanes serenus]